MNEYQTCKCLTLPMEVLTNKRDKESFQIIFHTLSILYAEISHTRHTSYSFNHSYEFHHKYNEKYLLVGDIYDRLHFKPYCKNLTGQSNFFIYFWSFSPNYWHLNVLCHVLTGLFFLRYWFYSLAIRFFFSLLFKDWKTYIFTFGFFFWTVFNWNILILLVIFFWNVRVIQKSAINFTIFPRAHFISQTFK